MDGERAILLFTSRDREGIIYAITEFIYKNGGNILELDQHVDRENGQFFMRVEWDLKNFRIPPEDIDTAFSPVGRRFDGRWRIEFSSHRENVAVFVSKEDHCLREILWRYKLGEFPMNLKLVISNHPDLEDIVRGEGIPFFVFPKNRENKLEQERKELALLREYEVETVILARYMQILTGQFVNRYPNRIINIHHSFLPAFVGSNPYRQAYDRGVKIIGATSHYVTEELDQGPIIEQDVIRISHRDSLEDIKKKGRDLERIVLARALTYHLEHRILVYGRKTVIFR